MPVVGGSETAGDDIVYKTGEGREESLASDTLSSNIDEAWGGPVEECTFKEGTSQRRVGRSKSSLARRRQVEGRVKAKKEKVKEWLERVSLLQGRKQITIREKDDERGTAKQPRLRDW